MPRLPIFNRAGDCDIVVNYSNAGLSAGHGYNLRIVSCSLEVTEVGQRIAGSAYSCYTCARNSSQ